MFYDKRIKRAEQDIVRLEEHNYCSHTEFVRKCQKAVGHADKGMILEIVIEKILDHLDLKLEIKAIPAQVELKPKK